MDKTQQAGVCLPEYRQIPEVGLFLEQVVQYVNECLDPLPGMTRSMISNYVKRGILPRPVKKQYSRQQIALVLFIAMVKEVLSLEELGRLWQLWQQRWTVEEGYECLRLRLAGQLLPEQPELLALAADAAAGRLRLMDCLERCREEEEAL